METAVLIENDPIHAAWLRACVGDVPDLQLTQQVASVDGAQAMLRGWRGQAPALALLALRLGARSGLELMAPLRSTWPGTAVLVLLQGVDDPQLLLAVRAVIRAIDAVRSGLFLMGAALARHLIARVDNDRQMDGTGPYGQTPTTQLGAWPSPWRAAQAAPPRGALAALTAREQQVLLCLSRGLTYDQAAADLAVSRSTVQSHVRKLYAKLAAKSKVSAIRRAQALGLIRDR